MSRFVFSEPGQRAPFGKRAVLLRVDGRLVREVDFGKSLRQERGINGNVRRRHSSRLEPELVEILENFRTSITAVEAEAAVASGRVSVIVNSLAANELEAEMMVSMGTHLEAALADGVEIGLRFGGGAVAGVPVTVATEAAVAHVLQTGASSVLGITQSTQAGIQEVLNLGITDALSPVEVAQKIGDLAGLSPRDVRAVENFRKMRTKQLVPSDRAMTPQVQRVIDQDVETYRQRQLLNRGRSIAETEIQNAVIAGEEAFWDEAVRSGAIEEGNAWKTWRTVGDSRVCPICEPLHGVTMKFKGVFATSRGAKNGPPAHPRCRCYLQYGEATPSGVPARPDRGTRALEENEAFRRITPEAVREDIEIAQRSRRRMQDRLRKAPIGTKGRKTIENTIEANAAAIRTMRTRLTELGEPFVPGG